jgi:F0F1-type ATP synthase alpha subunit
MYSSLLATTEGCFDKVPLEKLKTAEESLHRELKSKHSTLIATVNVGDKVSDDHQAVIVKVAKTVANTYSTVEAA